MITTSPILIDGSNSVFGGKVIDVSFVIEYSGPSKISVSVASADGNYSISDADIKVDPAAPVKISFGTDAEKKEFKGYLIGYSTKLEGGIKTLSLDYYDSSIVDLDKKIVLLRGHHISSDNLNDRRIDLKSIVLVGNYYEIEESSGVSATRPKVSFEYGDTVLYGVKDLIFELRKKGIKVNNKVDAIVNTILENEIENVEKDFIGSVRDVLNSWGEELGVMFYWDCFADEINAINLSDRVDRADVEEEIRLIGECACESSDERNTIEHNFAEASVLIAQDQYSTDESGGEHLKSSEFYFIDAIDRANLRKYTDYDVEEKLTSRLIVTNGWQTGMSDLLNAASMGEKFYAGYIAACLLHKSIVADDYPTWAAEKETDNIASVYDGSDFDFMFENSAFLTGERFDNDVVNFLYGDALTVKPKFEIIGFAGEVMVPLVNALFEGLPQVTSLAGDMSKDKSYANKHQSVLLFEAKSNITLPDRVPAVETENEKNARLFKERESESLLGAITDPSKDRIFSSLQVVLKHAARWYYSTTQLTNKKYLTRQYEKQASWIYRKTDTQDSPLGELLNTRIVLPQEEQDPAVLNEGTVAIRFGGESTSWRSEVPVSDSVASFMASMSEEIVDDDANLSDKYMLDEYDLSESHPPIIKYLWEESDIATSIAGSSYARLSELRSNTGIDGVKDFGLIILDNGEANQFLGGNIYHAPAPEVKQLSQGLLSQNAEAARVYNLYVGAGYRYDRYIGGRPIVKFWPDTSVASVAQLDAMLAKKYRFKYKTKDSSSSSTSDTENLNFVKSVCVSGLDSQKTVSSSVEVSDMSVNEMLRMAGIDYIDASRQAIFTTSLIPLANGLTDVMAYVDDSPTFSKQIRYIGIPSHIPSIENGLESLTISVSDDGVHTDISIGNRKAKRESAERRYRNNSKRVYKSSSSRYSLIPNGRFSTRFLAGTNI